HVAIAEPGLQDAGVAAVARLVAVGQRTEELLRHRVVAQHGIGLPAGMQVAAPSPGDQPFDDPTGVFSLWQRRLYLLQLEQGRRQIGEQRAAVTPRPVELSASQAVTHAASLLSLASRAKPIAPLAAAAVPWAARRARMARIVPIPLVRLVEPLSQILDVL